MKKYYHATPYANLDSIREKGILPGFDGHVYLTDHPEDAAKFLRLRFCTKILVLEVELDESNVTESFDHNERFFKCKAYMYHGSTPRKSIKSASVYEY